MDYQKPEVTTYSEEELTASIEAHGGGGGTLS